MDANELLKEWPGWAKANAARVLDSPAWRLETRFGGRPARLTRCAGLSVPPIVLDVRLDDEPHVLALEITPLFPDLTLLKDRLSALPKEVLLALVEKECGVAFQFVEEVARRQLSIVGLSEKPVPDTAFAVSGAAGEARLAIDLTPEMGQRLGALANLDVAHPSIRALTREAFACLAEWTLADAELSALSVGDCLVPDEGFAPHWLLDLPCDDHVRAIADAKGALTFAQLADDALPPVPPPTALTLWHRGKPLATLEPVRLGAASAFRVATVSLRG